MTNDELVDRFSKLVDRYPAAALIVDEVLDHLASLAPEHVDAAKVLAHYRFCRDSPELAILLAALCHANRTDDGTAKAESDEAINDDPWEDVPTEPVDPAQRVTVCEVSDPSRRNDDPTH